MKIIEVSHLTKKYKKSVTNAVDNISFDIEEGEFFAFLGPNGAGKTTTISILTTTLAKTSGSILIGGFDVDKNPADVRARIGVIFQKPSLDENLTAEENIRLHTFFYKMYPFVLGFAQMPSEYKDKVYELAEVLGLKDEIFKPIKIFSGGMKRKLEILRTLMHKPKVLFLDEPTSGLDPQSRRNLWSYLRDIRKREQTTIFLTTHYLDEAEDADKVCVIKQGKIILNEATSTLKNRLVKDYVYLESNTKKDLENELRNHSYKYISSREGFNVIIENTEVQKLIKSLQSRITKIHVAQPTLEEAYIELIQDSKEDQI